MSVINTNTLSLVTQNNLTKSQGALNSAIERLSSGMRINSAKDDSAGQAIANRFTANIKGLSQAQRNANDGISMAQTTEGALNEVNTNLQRIRELAVQAANGSNSTADKVSIQAEITQRLAEIDRTSTQTNFNGTAVLSADKTLLIQVGANDTQTVGIALKKIDSAALSLSAFTVAGNSLSVGDALKTAGGGTVSLTAAAASLSTATGKTVGENTLSLHNVLSSTGAPTAQYVVKSGEDFYAASVSAVTGSLGTVNLNKVTAVNFADAANGAAAAPLDRFVKVGTDTSGAAVAYVANQGKNFAVTAATSLLADSATATATSVASTTATIQLSTANGVTATAEFAGAATSGPMAKLDAALKIVDDLRGSLGAVQNRFDSIIANLGTTVTNLSASRSRIEDADYAVEVSNMTRAQILQQAGTSVLAKANQSTEGVMSLLR